MILNLRQVGEAYGLRWPFDESDVQSEMRYLDKVKRRKMLPEKTDKETIEFIKKYNEEKENVD